MEMLFEKKGKQNTDATVAVAVEAARERGIGHLVLASNSGFTARALLAAGPGDLELTCVTHHVGFKEPGLDEMGDEARTELADAGFRILTTTHALAGVDRALRVKFGGIDPPEIMAGALRMFGQGLKVCVEIAIMALDAGMVPFGRDILTVGGTGRGADTACVIRPAHSNAVLDTRVVEILCRPKC
jgi:hypothetical protein